MDSLLTKDKSSFVFFLLKMSFVPEAFQIYPKLARGDGTSGSLSIAATDSGHQHWPSARLGKAAVLWS